MDTALVAAGCVAVLLVIAVVFVLIARATRKRLKRLGGAWAAYARARGWELIPASGGYHYAPGLGRPPTIRGMAEGVAVEIRATMGRQGDRTEVSSGAPAWLPAQTAASVLRRSGLGAWLSGSSAAPTGDPPFDQALVAGVEPAAVTPVLLNAEARVWLLQVASSPSFQGFSCYNWGQGRAPANRVATVAFEGHVATAELLDAAVRVLVAIARPRG